MSWLDRIREANRHDLERHRRFVVAGEAVGWIDERNAALLAGWRHVFEVTDDTVRLAAPLDRPDTPEPERSAAVAEVLRALHDRGDIDGWRDELYPVARHPQDTPLLLVERAAVPMFGVTGYGVHVNGIVRDPGGGAPRMWIARRSFAKPTYPGELDKVVINITDRKLTEEELEEYRKGRLHGALAQ